MSTKRQKRKTRQVRIPEKWHRVFKIEATVKDLTMSKHLEEFFEENHPKTKSNGKYNSK